MSDLVEFHLILHSEVDIDRAPVVVWPYLDMLRDWKQSVISVERIAGTSDAVGEVLRIGQRPAGQTVYVLQRTLRVQPPRWKVQSLNTEDGVSTNGYIIYSLQEQRREQTRLICDVAALVRAPAAAAKQSGSPDEFAQAANTATQAKLDADHRELKRLVEQA